MTLGVPGRHNALNAAAAYAAAVHGLGQDPDRVIAGLASFTGTRRRFEPKGEAGGVVVVDDYAHNAGKVAAVVETAKDLVGDSGRLVVVFQPHLYSRTRDFAAELGPVSRPLTSWWSWTSTPPGRTPLPGVSGRLVADAVHSRPARGRASTTCPRGPTSPTAWPPLARPGDLVLTVGAGDVTMIGPEVLRAPRGWVAVMLERGTSRRRVAGTGLASVTHALRAPRCGSTSPAPPGRRRPRRPSCSSAASSPGSGGSAVSSRPRRSRSTGSPPPRRLRCAASRPGAPRGPADARRHRRRHQRLLADRAWSSVSVSRSLPDTVVITVTPRVAVLAVRNPRGEVDVVDRDGFTFRTVGSAPADVPLVSSGPPRSPRRVSTAALAALGSLDAVAARRRLRGVACRRPTRSPSPSRRKGEHARRSSGAAPATASARPSS